MKGGCLRCSGSGLRQRPSERTVIEGPIGRYASVLGGFFEALRPIPAKQGATEPYVMLQCALI